MSTLRLRVSPGAARNAGALSVPARDVAVVSGHGSRDRRVALRGLDPDEIERRLAIASGPGKDSQ